MLCPMHSVNQWGVDNIIKMTIFCQMTSECFTVYKHHSNTSVVSVYSSLCLSKSRDTHLHMQSEGYTLEVESFEALLVRVSTYTHENIVYR